jgi:hypothetical protein
MMLRILQKGQICPQHLPAHIDNDTLGLPKYSPRVTNPNPRISNSLNGLRNHQMLKWDTRTIKL